MTVAKTFIISKEAVSTWKETLEIGGIQVEEKIERIEERDRPYCLSAGFLVCPWGRLRYDVQSDPFDIPLDNPRKLRGFILQVHCSTRTDGKGLEDTIGRFFCKP